MKDALINWLKKRTKSNGTTVSSNGDVKTRPESTCLRTFTRIASRISFSSRPWKKSKNGLDRTISTKLTPRLTVKTACMKSVLLRKPSTRRLTRLMCFAKWVREIALCAVTCKIACMKSGLPNWPRLSTRDASKVSSKIMIHCWRPGRTLSKAIDRIILQVANQS